MQHHGPAETACMTNGWVKRGINTLIETVRMERILRQLSPVFPAIISVTLDCVVVHRVKLRMIWALDWLRHCVLKEQNDRADVSDELLGCGA